MPHIRADKNVSLPIRTTVRNSAPAAVIGMTRRLESRGTSPRNYRNAIVFLAADTQRLRELEQAVRQYLAWTGIWNEREQLNLDAFQTKQAETKKKNADDTVEVRIPETFQWLLVPGQPDPKGKIEWTEVKLQGQEGLAARASKKMRNEELLLVQMGGVRLRLELDKIPLWRGDHVGVKQLAEDFGKYLYLPRLKDTDVLLGAIRDGINRTTWNPETFGYADRWDEASKRYIGLQYGRALQVHLDAQSVLVKPEAAARQIEADRVQRQQQEAQREPQQDATGHGHAPEDREEESADRDRRPPPKLRRFHGSVELNPERFTRDAGQVAQEVIQHLSAMFGANVRLILEIDADIPHGAPDEVVRTVTENCRTLKFTSQGFEET